jgi:hypothetical protein
VEDLGLVAFGRDLVSLDAILLNLGDNLTLQNNTRLPLEIAERELGPYDKELLRESKMKVGSWIPR